MRPAAGGLAGARLASAEPHAAEPAKAALYAGHATAVASSIPDYRRIQRWLIPGAVLRCGAALSIDHPAVERALCEAGAVWIWIRPGREWVREASGIRAALTIALTGMSHASEGAFTAPCPCEPDSREIPGSSNDEDAMLRLVALDVIDRELAPLIASHGGSITLREVQSGCVSVEMNGACRGCDLAAVTLHLRIGAAIRERAPHLVDVIDVTPRARPGVFAGLFRAKAARAA